MPAGFVDIHSHVVPSGDDGVSSVAEGIALCREAALRGTAVLFATPHVFPHLQLTPEREQAVRQAFAEVRAGAGLELRLGFELTPSRHLLAEDPARYELGGTGTVLIEVPFTGPADELFALCEHVEGSGLRPVIAHPERTESVHRDPRIAAELAGRDWLLQVNATSLTGRHGPGPQELGWRFLEQGLATIVASDGHRETRPPHLDEAYAAATERLGEEEAVRFFDGSEVSARPTPSRAASTGA